VRRSEPAAYGEIKAKGSDAKLRESSAIARVEVSWLMSKGVVIGTSAAAFRAGTAQSPSKMKR